MGGFGPRLRLWHDLEIPTRDRLEAAVRGELTEPVR